MGPPRATTRGRSTPALLLPKLPGSRWVAFALPCPVGRWAKAKSWGVPGKRTLPPDYRHPQLHPGSHGQSRVPSWTWQQPPNPSPDFWQQQQLGIVQWKGGQWKSNLETLDILCVGSLGVQMCHVNSWGGMSLFNSFVVCVCLA